MGFCRTAKLDQEKPTRKNLVWSCFVMLAGEEEPREMECLEHGQTQLVNEKD